MSALQQGIRNINIRFDAYGEDDPEFKADLIMLMIENLRELQTASGASHDQNDIKVFNTALHKTKSTISLIDDADFLVQIESVKQALASTAECNLQNVASFRIFIDVLIRSLDHHARSLRGN